jgi:hypothetical protein
MDINQELKNYLDAKGQLKQYPSKQRQQKIAMIFLASKFEPDRIYTEKEVNAVLDNACNFLNASGLRRDLIVNKFLNRKTDGSQYWLEKVQPTLQQLNLE